MKKATFLTLLLAWPMLFLSCQSETGGQKPYDPLPDAVAGTTRSDPMLKANVDRLVKEILGGYKGSTSIFLTLGTSQELSANPVVKYPVIHHLFANPKGGIFDTAKAKEATRRLFELYGITLKSDVLMEGSRYSFVADGYNAEDGVGFVLTRSLVPGFRHGSVRVQDPSDLDSREQNVLDEEVQAGDVKMFVVNVENFSSASPYTSMEFYLQSVIDYLNWINGDKQIDVNDVLGKPRGTIPIIICY